MDASRNKSVMPRKPRIEFEGAIYHIMSRGNRHEDIFHDDRDCETFMDTLDEACSRTGWLVHAFVLMGNHYHLLLETPGANLVAGMKWLQGTYTQRYNTRHRIVGHLLQGRYKALLVDGSESGYFLTAGNYVHLNPARGKIFDLSCLDLVDYHWSSYPLYLKPSKRPAWLNANRLLGCLGLEDNPLGRGYYRDYIRKRVLEVTLGDNPTDIDSSWDKIRHDWCLGSEVFRYEMIERMKLLSGKRESFSGQEINLHDEQEAEHLVTEGLKVLGFNEKQLQTLRKGAEEKALLAWLVRRNSVVTNLWIAERLGMGRADCLSRYPAMIEKSKDVRIIEMKKELLKITKIRD